MLEKFESFVKIKESRGFDWIEEDAEFILDELGDSGIQFVDGETALQVIVEFLKYLINDEGT